MQIPRQRRGFALAIAMVGIVVIGALIAGAFWTSTQEFRSGRNALVSERALAAAEYGQNWVLANWQNSWATGKAPGDTIGPRTLTVDGNSTARVMMTRLNLYTYAIVSEGVAGTGDQGQARRRVSSVIRLDVPNIKITGAVTTASTTNFTGSISANAISGNDVQPASWAECPPSGPAKAAVSNDNPGTEVTTAGGCGSTPSTSACFTSTPKLSTDASAGDAQTYNAFGDYSWAQLTAMANAAHTYSSAPPFNRPLPVGTSTTCTTTDATNWGEPLRGTGTVVGCQNYYPVIWIKAAAGPTLLNSTGRGQGILLVEGNLSFQGQFQFYGLVIVKGQFSMAGSGSTGAKLTGALLAGGGINSFSGNSYVQYSSCAVATALNQQQPKPQLVADRSWTNMY